MPCIYYGTEQGLHGAGSDPAVREALWGGPGHDPNSPFYQQIARILGLRSDQAALRYGRFYFRQLSGDGASFGFSSFTPGVLAFSRILNDRDIIAASNFSKASPQTLFVGVDFTLSKDGTALNILHSNKPAPAPAEPTRKLPKARVTQADGSVSQGICATRVTLAPGEVQILG